MTMEEYLEPEDCHLHPDDDGALEDYPPRTPAREGAGVVVVLSSRVTMDGNVQIMLRPTPAEHARHDPRNHSSRCCICCRRRLFDDLDLSHHEHRHLEEFVHVSRKMQSKKKTWAEA
jgi:hypothetical protein